MPAGEVPAACLACEAGEAAGEGEAGEAAGEGEAGEELRRRRRW